MPELSTLTVNGATYEIRDAKARLNTWLPSLDDIGAAPSGYGLGVTPVTLKTSAEVNNATTNGWYRISNADKLSIAGWTATDWWMQVTAYSSKYCVQRIFPMSANRMELIRWCYDGEWYEEWVNPPMMLGIEYRTTERWKGKPVYVKSFSFGAMPNTTYKSESHNITDMAECLGAWGVAKTSGTGFGYFIPTGHKSSAVGTVDIYVNVTQVTVSTTMDWSGETAVITLKYTKTTD